MSGIQGWAVSEVTAVVRSRTEYEQAEDGFLGIVVGERFLEDFGKEAEDREARLVDGGRERGANDFELIEAGEFLPGPLDKPGAGQGHGLQRAAKALAALERGFGDAADFAVVARQEADDEVGFVHRPGAQHYGF